MKLSPLLENDLPDNIQQLVGKTITLPPPQTFIEAKAIYFSYTDFRIRINAITASGEDNNIWLFNVTVLSGTFLPGTWQLEKPLKCKWNLKDAEHFITMYFMSLYWKTSSNAYRRIKVEFDLPEHKNLIKQMNKVAVGQSFVSGRTRCTIDKFQITSDGRLLVTFKRNTVPKYVESVMQPYTFVRKFLAYAGYNGDFNVKFID